MRTSWRFSKLKNACVRAGDHQKLKNSCIRAGDSQNSCVRNEDSEKLVRTSRRFTIGAEVMRKSKRFTKSHGDELKIIKKKRTS